MKESSIQQKEESENYDAKSQGRLTGADVTDLHIVSEASMAIDKNGKCLQ